MKQNMVSTARMPAVFFGHGSPMNALEQNRYTEEWRRIGASMPEPKAILCVSAHWMTHGTAVTATDKPRTIHDFGGFPQELFAVQYPAPGSPLLAARVRELLLPVEVQLDKSWGLDHGTWSVLTHMFPDANVPVVQLSLDASQPPRYHYELGARLAPLRNEGVLIVGSGNVVHNLGRMQWAEDAKPYDWSVRFNETVRAHLAAREHQPLIDYASLGDDARLSVPTPEHYLPLLYILAQQGQGETLSLPVDGIEYGSIGMLTVAVGLEAKPALQT
ncbi:MAG TPA: 4,5-DOPA dioxygenase extradiol [Acidiferrobacterales bacterium]|nr:4,5-DOPA dioxygenase extradiol [Acidiferrobacterales bacterium]